MSESQYDEYADEGAELCENCRGMFDGIYPWAPKDAKPIHGSITYASLCFDCYTIKDGSEPTPDMRVTIGDH